MSSAEPSPLSSAPLDWNNQWKFVDAIDHASIGVTTNELDSEPLPTLEEYAKGITGSSFTLDAMREASLLFSSAPKESLPQSAPDASFFKRALNSIANNTSRRRDEVRFRDFDDRLAEEKRIGARLFGEVAEGGQREFYYLGDRIWVWNETKRDTLTNAETTSRTHYKIESDVIVKSQDGQSPVYASLVESRNLAEATQQYLQLVDELIYSEPPIAA